MKSLPNISKWKITKIYKTNFVFFNCSSLISLPDISKWKLFNKNAGIDLEIFSYSLENKNMIENFLFSHLKKDYKDDRFIGDFSINFK